MSEEIPLFLKSAKDMTDDELDSLIDKAKRGEYTFKFAKRREDIFVPTIYGKGPMIISDEIIGGRYSPGDGTFHDSKKSWMQSLEKNDIHFVDANAKPPPKKIDQISDQEYADTYQEARRMLKWKEETAGEKDIEDNKQIREAMLSKYGTQEERKPKNRRKIINGE